MLFLRKRDCTLATCDMRRTMKIREIRAVGLRGMTPEGGWNNELHPDDCVHTLIAVHTDEGMTGLGSVFTNDDLVRSALAVLAPLYDGENPLEPERVSEKLHQHTFWLGWGPFGRQSAALDEAIVRAARAAIGADALLMVDAGASDAFWAQGYKWALRTAQMLASYDVAWFEEPLRPDALDDYVLLRRAAPLPIAGGEVLTRRQSFQPWLQAGALDIVQPDVTKVGGISEERRIGWMAQDWGVRCIPHGWNTAVGLAADLQLASALAMTDLVEYLTGSPYVDDIAAGGWVLESDGMLAIPSAPGLGLELDADALRRYTRGERLLEP